MDFTQRAVRAMKKVAAPHAFNVRLNLGAVAGGSLADHLHSTWCPAGVGRQLHRGRRADQGDPAAALRNPGAAGRGWPERGTE